MFDHVQANRLYRNIGSDYYKPETRTFGKRKGNRLFRRAFKQKLSDLIFGEVESENFSENSDYFDDEMTDYCPPFISLKGYYDDEKDDLLFVTDGEFDNEDYDYDYPSYIDEQMRDW